MKIFADRFRRIFFVFRHRGIKGIGRIFFSGVLIKPIRSRVNYIRYQERYPQHQIFIAGFAKGGSSWFAHLLSSLPGFEEYTPVKWPIEEAKDPCEIYGGLFNEFSGKLAVLKGHTWGYPENVEQLRKQGAGKYIITVRDPRDCLISAYWYVRRLPAHWDYEKASTLSLEDYITDKLESGEFKEKFVAWLESWLENYDSANAIIVRYEDLLKDTAGELRRVFNFLSFDVSDGHIQQLIEKQSFERKSKRKRGQENTKSFLRKGVAGEWQSVFSDSQKGLAEDQCGSAVKELQKI